MSATQRLTISLGAIARNYQICQEHAQGPVGAVVKANGYGLGAAQVAGRLADPQAGCRHFFVATLSEAIALRQALPDHHIQIYVLEGLLSEPSTYLDQQLQPVLNTVEQCQRWHATGNAWVVHTDTGMQRLGLTTDELRNLVTTLKPSLELVLTHFACADEPGVEMNQQQLTAFSGTVAFIEKTLGSPVPVSLGNTAGLMSMPQLDGISRAGIGLYGGNPYAQEANPFHPVACLQGQIVQIRDLAPGVSVGYGGTFVTTRRTLAATVGVGYADGVPRLLSNQGRVWCDGHYAPILGRVSMDMLSVDVTDVPGIAEGDWVEVFGAHVSVDEVAALAQTISYEVLTGLGQRPHREFQEAFLD